MPLDALTLGGVVKELDRTLRGAKIDKIAQPERDEFLFSMRTPDGARRLLVSTSPNHARIHLTSRSKENPAQPPMFCMLLRKYLLGARIASVTQPGLERMAELALETTDELGREATYRLVFELMGRYSNAILVDPEGRVVECLKRVDAEMSERRQVLPGMFYHLPPQQDKLNLLDADIDEILTAAPREKRADKWLLETFYGISPLVCREIAFASCGETDRRIGDLSEYQLGKLARGIEKLRAQYENDELTPYILLDTKSGAPFDFSCLPLTQYGILYTGSTRRSFSELLDEFFTKKDDAERIVQHSSEMLHTIVNAHERVSRKLENQRDELSKTTSREELREKADILGAFANEIQRGAKSVTLPNLYGAEDETLEIKLDERLSPQANVQKYYKNYNRMKTASTVLAQQIALGEAEIEYLDTVFDELSRAESQKDLEEIRDELTDTGYLSKKRGSQKGKKPKQQPLKLRPMVFESPNGFAILVGRNNRQNDALTLREAEKSDLWFHTQKIPGSHVILVTEGQRPADADMTRAAELAAYFSKAQSSAQVPVDYTPVRYIKKPPAAKPGMVIYDRYQTAYVAPKGPENVKKDS